MTAYITPRMRADRSISNNTQSTQGRMFHARPNSATQNGPSTSSGYQRWTPHKPSDKKDNYVSAGNISYGQRSTGLAVISKTEPSPITTIPKVPIWPIQKAPSAITQEIKSTPPPPPPPSIWAGVVVKMEKKKALEAVETKKSADKKQRDAEEKAKESKLNAPHLPQVNNINGKLPDDDDLPPPIDEQEPFDDYPSIYTEESMDDYEFTDYE